ERGLQAALEALAQAPEEPVRARVEAGVGGYLRAIMADPRQIQVAFVEVVGASQAVERQRLELRELIVATVEREGDAAATRGEIVPRDFRFAALAFIGAVNSVLHDWTVRQPRPSTEQVQADLVDLAVLMLTRTSTAD